MINAINTFFDNLFGSHAITVYANSNVLFSLDLGKWISVILILVMCTAIASVGMWFFHIIFERSKK